MDTQTGPARLDQRIESLRARLPAGQFILLMRVFNACLAGGSDVSRLHLTPQEQELFTPEVRGEIVALLGLALPGTHGTPLRAA
ncbi:hypothetical protein [Streptomyces marincola]|uniref:Uncharacterized protein n=1 Tax=Streptomyces marincola TaxID=2878388 RepID=A0A1W7D432_9ACTN|nr:hypothetical protein [Streptomyces marincola]ARQ71340.1 hypothetical protein CAG99_23155 [Streptomyces marincola]